MDKTIFPVLALLLTGCVTPQALNTSPTGIDFSGYKTLSYRVHPGEATEYGGGPNDLQYGADTIALFDMLLGRKLQSMGYAIQPGNADLDLEITVRAAKPGNSTTRFLVGFGAGRAAFIFRAVFRDSHGREIGSFQGGNSYTGQEFGRGFASREDIQIFAANAGATQVETFIINRGRFPERAKAQAQGRP
jgi:hypothetical protein